MGRGSAGAVGPAHRCRVSGTGDDRGRDGCPDIWELDNGDFAVIGRDLTKAYSEGLPEDAVIGAGERLVVIPRLTLLAAKAHIPDA